MDSTKMAEGVGKKIVEALKQQSDVEIIPVKENPEEQVSENIPVSGSVGENSVADSSFGSDTFEGFNSGMSDFSVQGSENSIDKALNSTLMNFKTPDYSSQAAIEEMELPANVAVLRQLITKIPTGVSKQTGALIIKQTMEALGISMTNVLQEAQQVQERLTQSVKECQMNVLDYKKQINILEVQAQKYQRQFAAINDIISLFIQTN